MATFGRRVLPSGWLGLAFVALGCTSLLGIDGNYVSAPRDAGSGAALAGGTGEGSGGETQNGDGGRSNTGGETESGGADPGGAGGVGGLLTAGGSTGAGDTAGTGGTTGGTSGSGGTGATGNGGGTSALPCTAGVYVGTYTGTHRTSSSGTFVAVPVGGPVTVQVTNADGGMPKMAFTFTRPTTLPNDGLDAKANVIVDCSKNSGTGPFQSDATVTTTFIPGHGLITGEVQVSSRTETTLKGTWSEHENAVPDFAKGSGTWEATLR